MVVDIGVRMGWYIQEVPGGTCRHVVAGKSCSGLLVPVKKKFFLFFFSFFVFSNVLEINIGNVVVACSDGMNEIYSGLCTKEKKDLETG